jgi:predicted dehydrogenase
LAIYDELIAAAKTVPTLLSPEAYQQPHELAFDVEIGGVCLLQANVSEVLANSRRKTLMVRRNSTHSTRRDFLATTTAIGSGLLAGLSASATEVPLAPPDAQPPQLEIPKSEGEKIGWAIVGLGTLALGEVMPAFGECQRSKPVALVSGHPDKAKQVADFYHIDPDNIYNYENYDKLAENPEVQVIYIILPNSMHAEYTIRGLKAGKHVLCEKPLATSVNECEQMIAAAREAGKKLMTAYRLRYEPFNQRVIELCKKQELGKLKLITASNCQNVTPPNIRLSSKLGGGPVGDVGVYCINAARYITGQEPTEVTAREHQPSDDPRFREVPESVSFTLQFDSGVIAQCECSFGTADNRFYRIVCEKGVIELDNAFGYQGQELCIRRPDRSADQRITPVNHFAAEMDHFSECVVKGTDPLTSGEDGLADMRVVEAIGKASATGDRIRIES